MRRPMHRPSTIDKLDPDLRHEVDRLRIEDGKTIDEIVAFLRTMGAPVSRSSVGRHVCSLEETTALLREKREMAKAIMRGAGADPEDKLSELAVELIQGNLIDLAIAAQYEGGGDSEENLNNARAANALANTRKANVDRAAKIEAEAVKREERAAQKATKKALDAVDRVAATKGSGMTKATIQAIYSAVLGAD